MTHIVITALFLGVEEQKTKYQEGTGYMNFDTSSQWATAWKSSP